MFDALKKLSEAKAKAAETQKALDAVYVKGESPEGLVKVISTANGRIHDVEIDDGLLTDKEALSDYLVLAMNDANLKATSIKEEELKKSAKDLLPGGIPGLGDLF